MLKDQKLVLKDSIDKLQRYTVAAALTKSMEAIDQHINDINQSSNTALEVDKEIMNQVELLFQKKISDLERNKPKFRVLEKYCPSDRVQDRIFPLEADLNFNNYLVGVLDAKTDVQYNFKFSDGSVSKITAERA